MSRQRSNSEPNSPEPKRRTKLSDVQLDQQNTLRHAYSELSPIHSPTSPNSTSSGDLPDNLKAPTFSRKITSSIRRRLSSRAKSGQRLSASDVLDDRSPRSPPIEVNFGEPSFPGTLNRGDYAGGKVKRGFLRKIGKSNSFRRKSDSNLNKFSVKRSDMDGPARSPEG